MESREVRRSTLVWIYCLSLGTGVAILLIGVGMLFVHARLDVAAEQRYLACYAAKCGQLNSLKSAAASSRLSGVVWLGPLVEISGLATAVTSLVNLLAVIFVYRKQP